MAKLYLIRHGQDTGSGGADPDPGLNENGHSQAAEMAARMASLGPLPMIVSPLRRTRETAAPLEAAWNTTATVVDAVREIPSPTERTVVRRDWLRQIMAGTWDQVEPSLYPWRQGVIDTLLALAKDTVVVSHFVAINAAVGAAENDERLRLFRPNNCSITVMENDGGELSVVDLGEALETEVG
ncbi:MAG: histidine phosphatase family protein [Rhodospirillaceae bacterium]|jgi:broad specificity phosphatase PhoE|nr:histidine phosphatase family protein [Rhodospirillaceae bacterium]MBT5195694.1 histidine phosphatase family protein [Rhodospirillaceae bacterium]MBT5895285.1 histidine phosphatase family protein [Rhodospirillaceae bacterium]MBT6428697.1 histidine phosphatase family protein [Rhodospirillaceae bacterium]MBT7756156.1 histidine phosphatase family protein [Rhodospirillaceae bacterium]